MSDRSKLEAFSADELLLELRSRENQAKIAGTVEIQLTANPLLAEFSPTDIATVLRAKQKVIYGVDDRIDLYRADAVIQRDADCVVALLRRQEVVDNGDGTSTIQVEQFAELYNLCPNEPFANQPSGAFCSGFLVGRDLVATAGHCIDPDAFALADIRFVFGFRMEDDLKARTVIDSSEIYRGSQLVDYRHTSNGADWGLVRLDRPVANHQIVQVRRTGRIEGDQQVHVIGHPCGLPTKYAGGATVRDNTADAFFVANLDTYGGNSGSPVFNSTDHTVEGILVRGETDFVKLETCRVSNVCPSDGCSGESVNRTTEFASLIPDVHAIIPDPEVRRTT